MSKLQNNTTVRAAPIVSYGPNVRTLFSAILGECDPAAELAAARRELHDLARENARLTLETRLLRATVAALADGDMPPTKRALAEAALADRSSRS